MTRPINHVLLFFLILMKQSIRIVAFLLLAVTMLGCKGGKKGGRVVATATGSIYELMVVMNNNYWETAAGDSVRAYLGADMPCMPQMEPYFSLSQCSWATFDDYIKPVRNLLLCDVNHDRYDSCHLSFATDLYAHPQAVARVTAPSGEALAAFLGQKGGSIQTYFLRSELLRQASFYKKQVNHEGEQALLEQWGVDLKIPSDYQLIRRDSDFIWFCCDNGPKRRDIVLWATPYTSADVFCLDSLCARRDRMMARVEGYVEGSYMGTEYRIFPPEYHALSLPMGNETAFAAELRGLWKMKGGAAMGGPFVQHTRVDETHNRLITVEAFVFAAGQKKRNAYRQAEAILYTLRMPEEIR